MKMNKMLKYKGFIGSSEISLDDGCLYGKIECINDLVTYEATSVEGLIEAFNEAVDDYIATCLEIGKDPEKPMSGSFNVRVGSDLHKKAFYKSKEQGVSLNDFVKNAIQQILALNEKSTFHFHFHEKAERKKVVQAMPNNIHRFPVQSFSR